MERMFLKDLVDSNGDRIVHYTKCKDENKYVSVFNYSANMVEHLIVLNIIMIML